MSVAMMMRQCNRTAEEQREDREVGGSVQRAEKHGIPETKGLRCGVKLFYAENSVKFACFREFPRETSLILVAIHPRDLAKLAKADQIHSQLGLFAQ